MLAIEAAIRISYIEFTEAVTQRVTADDILCDPDIEEQFWAYFDRHHPEFADEVREEKNRALLRLRKRGENNGGLRRTPK